MGNHYHLMVRTPEGNLQRIMRHINGVYTQYFNRSEQTDGALFRGRYKAILVDANAYWSQLSRYIHRNPIEASIVDSLNAYHWSSYPAYAGLVAKPTWLSIDYILGAVGGKSAYVSFVNQREDDKLTTFYAGKKQSPILGDSSFRQQVLRDMRSTIDQPDLKRARKLPSIAEIIRVTARHFDCEENSLYHSTRGKGVTSPARSVAMYLCHEIGGNTLSQIAEAFGLASYASAGSTIRNIRLRIKHDELLRNNIDLIKLDLPP